MSGNVAFPAQLLKMHLNFSNHAKTLGNANFGEHFSPEFYLFFLFLFYFFFETQIMSVFSFFFKSKSNEDPSMDLTEFIKM